jgi:hypothetical protein
MLPYIYRLGHCRDLAIAEYTTLTKDTNISIHGSWLFSSTKIDTNTSGSLVFGGEVIAKIPKNEQTREEIINTLYEYIVANSADLKKLGISVPLDYSKNLLDLAKKAGAKKINIIKDQLPNYGHKKSVKNWIVITEIANELVIFKILSYADQQFWSEIDERLPGNDMRRGMINLKLARSLVNLVYSKSIYDPFCGVGRVAVAAYDKDKEWLLSDIDESCLADCQENIDQAKYLWRIRKQFETDKNIEIFEQDVKEIDGLNQSLSEVAIVTEGYLGVNYGRELNDEEIAREFDLQTELWTKTLKASKNKKISQLVFCLPYYIRKDADILPLWIKEVAHSTGYKMENLNEKGMVLYRRDNTKVGHAIVKLTLGK